MRTLRACIDDFRGQYAGTDYAASCYGKVEQRVVMHTAAAIEELLNVHVPAMADLCDKVMEAPVDPSGFGVSSELDKFEDAVRNLDGVMGGQGRRDSFCRALKAFGGMAEDLAELLQNGDEDPDRMVDFHSRYLEMVRGQEEDRRNEPFASLRGCSEE